MKYYLKKHIYILIFFFCALAFDYAQQYPFFTQYRGNFYFYNPAFCGTKRWLDARLYYRNQWVGLSGAPTTAGVSINMRYLKGKLGSGLILFNDKIGPFVTNHIQGNFAYHLQMSDVELSFGFSGAYTIQQINPAFVKPMTHIDAAIDLASSGQSVKKWEGACGALLYNDRFFLSFSITNLFGAEYKYQFSNPDFFKGKYTNENHMILGVGYNFGENPDFIWENSFFIVSTKAVPLFLDYTLRLHIRHSLFTGISIRPGNAIAAHLGITIADKYQIGYSYDLLISKLNTGQSGSHELNLIMSLNKYNSNKRGGINKQFLRQKYQYLLN